MGKQVGIISFTGKLGNLIGYRRNGQYFVRTMPETVRQTAACKAKVRHKQACPHFPGTPRYLHCL
ncbi:hypothetical protein QFZ51_000011 [Chitinophaga sp. W3I9]|uniref:hypothetical protein n=1 Tax=Chitinophaga sp. W3I9 TaxID=3373924 RepID=UPI003D1F5282